MIWAVPEQCYIPDISFSSALQDLARQIVEIQLGINFKFLLKIRPLGRLSAKPHQKRCARNQSGRDEVLIADVCTGVRYKLEPEAIATIGFRQEVVSKAMKIVCVLRDPQPRHRHSLV